MSLRMLRTSAHVQPQTAAMAEGLRATVAFESLDLKGEMLWLSSVRFSLLPSKISREGTYTYSSFL